MARHKARARVLQLLFAATVWAALLAAVGRAEGRGALLEGDGWGQGQTTEHGKRAVTYIAAQTWLVERSGKGGRVDDWLLTARPPLRRTQLPGLQLRGVVVLLRWVRLEPNLTDDFN